MKTLRGGPGAIRFCSGGQRHGGQEHRLRRRWGAAWLLRASCSHLGDGILASGTGLCRTHRSHSQAMTGGGGGLGG